MDAQKVDLFLATTREYFEPHMYPTLRERLLNADDSKEDAIMSLPLKSPLIALMLSVWFGIWGIDRFFIGDTGLGIAKLLTAGGCGIWTIIDLFQIQQATRKKNLDLLFQVL